MAQGFSVSDNILFQDNQSAIRLEKNGKASSGKRMRHLNIGYFFVTNRVSKNEMRVEYCPTDLMIANFYTKPLQGKAFRLFQSLILNIDDPLMHTNIVSVDKPKVPAEMTNIISNSAQECVTCM